MSFANNHLKSLLNRTSKKLVYKFLSRPRVHHTWDTLPPLASLVSGVSMISLFVRQVGRRPTQSGGGWIGIAGRAVRWVGGSSFLKLFWVLIWAMGWTLSLSCHFYSLVPELLGVLFYPPDENGINVITCWWRIVLCHQMVAVLMLLPKWQCLIRANFWCVGAASCLIGCIAMSSQAKLKWRKYHLVKDSFFMLSVGGWWLRCCHCFWNCDVWQGQKNLICGRGILLD